MKKKHDDKLADYYANPTLLDRVEEFCTGAQSAAVPTLVGAGFVAVSNAAHWAVSAVSGMGNLAAACNVAGAVVATGTAAVVGLSGYLFVGNNFPMKERAVMRKLGAAFTVLAAAGLGFATTGKLQNVFNAKAAAPVTAPATKHGRALADCTILRATPPASSTSCPAAS